MPCTRKQKANEKRSRQSDVLSDFENMDLMLGLYSRNVIKRNQKERNIEADLESVGPRQNLDQNGKEIRSLMNTNITGNGEITIKSTGLISSEVTDQMTRKLDELKRTSNSQILETINSALNKKVLSSVQNTLERPGLRSRKNADLGSSRLNRNTGVKKRNKARENCPKSEAATSYHFQHSKESSVNYVGTDIDYDILADYRTGFPNITALSGI